MVVVVIVFLIAVIVITQPKEPVVITDEDRLSAIPASAVKMAPEDDEFVPVVHSDEWQQPIPMPGGVNSAGAEDSPYMTEDGDWFFFFFTPDVTVPANEQLTDGVTGIWWTRYTGTEWTAPEKIVLHDDLSLDGAQCCVGTTLWFASVRADNYGEIDVFTAQFEGGIWTDVENVGTQLNVDYDIGEFHLMPNGTMMYFHSGSWDAGGSMDIWSTVMVGDQWSTPVKVEGVNTDSANEGFPYVSPDGSELWFTAESTLGEGYTGPAIFRSVLQANGTWGTPEEIVSNFAGECTFDDKGNLYFVHHYFVDGEMIEADIYVALKN
ncbi:MAG: hypothetical protein AB7S97_04420 [Thermoplasmata archaeon]